MKKLLILSTLIFSVMFSSPSYAEWTKVGETADGITLYVDFDRIRKVDGYVYWWSLSDFLKPQRGTLSVKAYYQGDCKLFRHKTLNGSFHIKSMGKGTASHSETPKNPEWNYPSPDSVNEDVLKSVCSR